MVHLGVAERHRVRDRESMEMMGSERSKPLHDFTLPCLRWGNQKYLRCMKVESGADRRSVDSRFADPSHWSGSRRRDSEFDGEEGIDAVREKLTLDLKTAASKMKDAILRKGPWNLRTRRAACKEPVAGERNPSYSPMRSDGAAAVKLPRVRGSPEKKERPKFSVSLSRKEIEDDYESMLGERLPRRPKKRAKIVQKQLDLLFPGLWLTEVSEDMYKVAELPENGKVHLEGKKINKSEYLAIRRGLEWSSIESRQVYTVDMDASNFTIVIHQQSLVMDQSTIIEDIASLIVGLSNTVIQVVSKHNNEVAHNLA